jgi:class 3 adenylate cyclase
MPLQATEGLPLKDMFGHVGDLPIPVQRIRILSTIRLVIFVPIAMLPTQVYMRSRLGLGWDPEFGRFVVDVHLWAFLLYLPVNLLLVWKADKASGASYAALMRLNAVAIACEIATNQAYLVGFGNLDNYSVGFLVIIVALYRVLFDYRVAVATAVVLLVCYLGFACLEISGALPAAVLFPEVASHPVRSDSRVWATVLFSVPLMVVLTFMVVNFAVNQSVRLHLYITRSVLQRYLPPALVDRAAAGELHMDAPHERRVVTVMFTDIVGFTALSERLGPEAVGALLNDLLGEIAQLALDHGATVDKFIGDCVMVVFGAPEPCPPGEQARRCVDLALAIHAHVARVGKEHALQARTGLNTGEVVVGNFGSAARSDYTVVGPAVNVAARLESASQPNRILLGKDTAAHLDGKVALVPAGPLKLKGVSESVEAWFVESAGS